MYIWNTSALAQDLALQRLSEKQKAQYLFVGLACYVIFSYAPLLPCAEFDAWLAVEGIVVLLVTGMGIFKCYQNNGGQGGRHLLESFMCLAVPLFIKITLIFWGALAAFFWISGPYVADAPKTEYQMLHTVYNLVIFSTVVLSTALFYLRMSRHIAKINQIRNKQ